MSQVGIRWPRATAASGTVSLGSRVDLVLTTASLANGAAESGVIALGKTFILLRVLASFACRVRLYATAAYRTADSARAIGVNPTGEHGCIFDANMVAANLTLDTMLQPRGSNLDAVLSSNIYYNIENKSGATHVITVTFTRQVREA